MQPTDNKELGESNRKIVSRLLVFVVFMSCFGFALVPLYDVFCDVTGLRFTDLEEKAASNQTVTSRVDEHRTVKVQFVANMNTGGRWTFKPDIFEMEVHPGKLEETIFYAENLSQMKKVAQAVPDVLPKVATPYFHKTECFCFNEQAFEPQEGKDMPLRFVVDPELPEKIKTITLSYTFFELDKVATK